jgi:hypothetical protein
MSELLTKEYFLHRYRVTVIHEMSARDEHDARQQADSYTRKSVKVEKIQDRSIPHQDYLRRMGEKTE